MAKYNSGYLGPFGGKLGTAIGTTWKGINVLRARGRRRHTPPSPKQQIQMAKFSLVGKLIRSMAALFKVTFKDYAVGITEQNYAFHYMWNNVLTGTYPNLGFDYPRAIVAQGSITNVVNPSATNGGPGQISFNWIDNSGNGIAKAEDKTILVAYCEELNQCEFKLPGAKRQATTDSMVVVAFSGKQVHTWISVIADDGNVATSIYTGALNVN